MKIPSQIGQEICERFLINCTGNESFIGWSCIACSTGLTLFVLTKLWAGYTSSTSLAARVSPQIQLEEQVFSSILQNDQESFLSHLQKKYQFQNAEVTKEKFLKYLVKSVSDNFFLERYKTLLFPFLNRQCEFYQKIKENPKIVDLDKADQNTKKQLNFIEKKTREQILGGLMIQKGGKYQFIKLIEKGIEFEINDSFKESFITLFKNSVKKNEVDREKLKFVMTPYVEEQLKKYEEIANQQNEKK